MRLFKTKKDDLSGAKHIDDFAFENCSKLMDVGNILSVERVGERAFRGCEELLNIKLDDVKEIGNVHLNIVRN